MMLILISVPSFSEGEIGGTGVVNYATTEETDNIGVSTTTDTQKNFNIYFARPFTPLISYQFNLRAQLSDSDTLDAQGASLTTTKEIYEPAIDLSLKNIMYEIGTGLRHREELYSTSGLSNNRTRTSDFFYSRFTVSPKLLPSFSAELNHQADNDNLMLDHTNNNYVFRSFYELPSPDLDFRMTLNYSHNDDQSPKSIIYKSVTNNLSGDYDLGYAKAFWNRKALISATYRGNFTRSNSISFFSDTGFVFFERAGIGGLYAKGVPLQPLVDVLSTGINSLTNDDHIAVASGISLSNLGNEFHNIGIWVASDKSVDKLYIYVNKDVTGDLSLKSISNWKVYKSDLNTAGTWSLVGITGITVSAFDFMNNIYRYEIEFSGSQNARYFKAVNMAVSSVSGVSVTEIEAYGTENVPDSGELSDMSNSFSQRLDLTSSIQPLSKLRFLMNFSIDKSDQNTSSALSSITGIVTSIFSKSESSESDPEFSSTISKNLGLVTTYYAHRLLTANMRFQLNQSYDNNFYTDRGSRTYELSFNSSPLDTLSANLSILKSDIYEFETLVSTYDSVYLSVGARLYRNVNMVTDIGYTSSNSVSSINPQATAKYISGNIDSVFTDKLSGSLRYGLTVKTDENSDIISKSGSANITYRPGSFINLSGDLDYSATDEILTMSELFSAEWRPVPVIQLSANYRHSSSAPGNSTKDTFSGNGTWHIKRSVDLQIALLHEVEGERTKQYFHTGLNLRF